MKYLVYVKSLEEIISSIDTMWFISEHKEGGEWRKYKSHGF